MRGMQCNVEFREEAKTSVRTSKRTKPVTITNISLLTRFNEIIPVYTDIEDHFVPINTKYRVTNCYSGWYVLLPLGVKGLSHHF
jgi:hypothetical protein